MTDAAATPTKGFTRGEVKTVKLDRVEPNPWNPNEVSEALMESIRHGFQTDGWLVSQALLVWGKDEKGVERNLIIDGEHRHKCAKDVGILKGPMVFLDGLTEQEAKALTIKMNQKRGDWKKDDLNALLKSLEMDGYSLDALDLGFDQESLLSMLATTPTELVDVAPPEATAASGAGIASDHTLANVGVEVRVAQLAYSREEYDEYVKHAKKLMLNAPQGKTVSGVILDLMRAAAEPS